MHHAPLASPTDWDGWRRHARGFVLAGIPPEQVAWAVEGEPAGLFGPTAPAPAPDRPGEVRVPRAFLPLSQQVILHRDPARFMLLHRMLARLQDEPRLIEVASDPDVARLAALAKAVRRDQHKMKAFVRFRTIHDEEGERYVAWFEPAHHIVEATAPFFQRRFAAMRFAILTPDRCASWDGTRMTFAPGADRADAPAEDAMEEAWRVYYASIFNPARLKVDAMRAEMPRKYWRNLPEASLIPALIGESQTRTQEMIAAMPREPKPNRHRLVASASADAPPAAAGSLEALRRDAQGCRACPLWAPATQTVFGEGREGAAVMIVGEQPGDKEDLAGRPFVGPAGQLFDRALDELGIARAKLYVTNAVKHFKFEPRGKFRLHRSPNGGDIAACRPWLMGEIDLVKPRLVVAMGASAAQALFGRPTPVGRNRGTVMPLSEGRDALVTVHPSYLLRLPDGDREREYRAFADDLRLVLPFLETAA